MGAYHEDPKLNTLVYDVEFDNGMIKGYSANVIAENMLSQIEDKGFTVTHLTAIIDYQKSDEALSADSAFATVQGGA